MAAISSYGFPPMPPDVTVGARIAIVDDDPSMQRALDNLLRSAGWDVAIYGSADAYLNNGSPGVPTCVVVDIRLPGASGLDLQRELVARDVPPSIVFISGYADIAMAVEAMHRGAVDFLAKPFREQALLDAIRRGVQRHRVALDAHAERSDLRRRHASLTPREKEVLVLVAQGLANKEIAARLGLTEATVKAHRGQVMRKMQAGSLADLVVMGLGLDVVPGPRLARQGRGDAPAS